MPKTKTPLRDGGLWHARWRLEKYEEDIAPYERRARRWWVRLLARLRLIEHPIAAFYRLFRPTEVLEWEGNLLLNEGINEAWALVCATGGTAYSNANARIGVGDGTTAAAATDTDLVGINKTFKGMEVGFPTVGSQKATFKSSFAGAEANHGWQEFMVDNGSVALKSLNRKVQNLGTKASGATWNLTVEITLS